MRLGHREDASRLHVGKRGHDHFRAQRGKLVVQRAGVVVRRDRNAALRKHCAGIEARVHLHDRNAGLRVAGKNRALDWRRAAPAWQQGSMNIEGTMCRDIEHRLRKNEAISGDHKRIGPRGADAGAAVSLQAVRLEHLEIAPQREALYRAHGRLQAAPGGPVRLRQYESDIMACLQQARQRSLGKFGSSRED